MNPGKLLPTFVILIAIAIAWFAWPPPAGLENSAVLAEAAARAQSRTGNKDISLDLVRRWRQSPSDVELDNVERRQLNRIWTTVSQPAEARQAAWKVWRLFLVFAGTISLVLVNAAPIFTLALGGLTAAILTGALTPAEGFRGYSEPIIILIVVAFTIALGVSQSGLGKRIAYLMISQLGGSTLGLGYSLTLTDVLIAPAFPSNTARSGVLFPIVNAIALNSGSEPEEATRKRLGAFLMMGSIVSLSLSSGLWLTAMSANPTGAALALQIADVKLTFGSWLLAAVVPTSVAFVISPWLLHRVFPPEVRRTPEARQLARDELAKMGPMSGQELITAAVFLGLVCLWALSDQWSLNTAAVAMAGLFVLLITGVLSVRDAARSNGPATFVWFGALFTLSTELNIKGFMDWIGQAVAGMVAGFPWPAVYLLLLVTYIVMHYGFVSQTAHLLAVMPVFLQVAVAAGVPPKLMAMMLLLATNFFSPLTPQASSANAIFVGSGYLQMGEIYRYGGLIVLCNTLVFGVLGTAWLWWLQ